MARSLVFLTTRICGWSSSQSTFRFRLVFMFVLVSLTSAGQVTFRTITSVNAPDEPYELARGDFNNDGLIDFVTANFTSAANQQITLLLNTGTGTFAGANLKNLPASTYLIDVAVGDFNKDGKLDVVACSDQNDNFSLLLGDGAGNLAAPVNFVAGDHPYGIAVGDFNKDTNPDVIISHSGTPDDVYIFAGNGSGGFSVPFILPIATNTAYDVTVADFNLDTNPDFAITTAGVYTVQVWRGNGSGTSFSNTQTITGIAINSDLDAQDLNGDGSPDLLVGPGYVMNNGTGTFGGAVVLSQSDEEYTAADLNNDGNVDIITSDNNVNRANARIYLGNGSGVFTLLAKFEMNVLARGLAVADVNNDGKADIVGAGGVSGDGRVDVLLGDGTGFMTNTITKYPVAADPRDLVVADFNNDGKSDVALTHSAGNQITVYLGQGQDRFVKTPGNHATGTFPGRIMAFDYNGDDNIDLVTNNQNGASITVLTGNGTGGFSLLNHFTVPTNPFGIAVADFNGDSRPDIAASSNTANTIYLLTGTGTTFNAPSSVVVSNNIIDIAAADFNSDGKADIAAIFDNTDNFLVLTGSGSGTFTEGTQYATSQTYLLVTDLDNDSKPDVVGYGGGTATMHLFRNDGNGGFTFTNFGTTSSQFGLSHADLNGDGTRDLITGAQNSLSSSGGVIRAYQGTGTGTFGSSLFSRQLGGGNKLTAIELTGDTKTDIIATSFNIYEDYLAVWINTTVTAGCPSVITHPVNQTACSGQSASFSIVAAGNPTLGYQWIHGATPVAGATSATLTISVVGTADAGNYYCVVSNGCGSVNSNTATLSVNVAPGAPGSVPGSRCGPGSVIISATGGSTGEYRWYTVPTGGTAITGEVSNTYITPSIASTTTYHVALNNGSCEGSRTAVVASILALPAAPITTPGLGCLPSAAVTLTATGGVAGQYRWYTQSSGGTAIPGEVNNTFSTPLLSVPTTYYASIDDGTCESNRTAVLANIVSCIPSIASAKTSTTPGGVATLDIASIVTTVNSPLDIGSIHVIVPPVSGAVATVNAAILSVDYSGNGFAGIDELSIEACDMTAHCAQAVVEITVAGDVTVYNAISPNGDGKNDIFYLEYIDLLPDTQSNVVRIFDRWGSLVFEASDYDNAERVFRGLDQGGRDLPTGTYYYRIEFANGQGARTGFLSLRR